MIHRTFALLIVDLNRFSSTLCNSNPVKMCLLAFFIFALFCTTPTGCQSTANCVQKEQVLCDEVQATAERHEMFEVIMATLGDIQKEQRLIRNESKRNLSRCCRKSSESFIRMWFVLSHRITSKYC